MYPIWYQTAMHRMWVAPVSTVMATLFSVRTWGYEQVPRRGGLLVIANHQSFLDPVLVGMAVRRRMVYLARKTLFGNPLFDWLMESFGAIPIDQEKPTTEGIRMALELLRREEAIVIFPEGERTPHGQMQEVKPGVTLLVRRGQAPVLPVGIAGAFDVWPRHQLLPRLCPIWSRQPRRLKLQPGPKPGEGTLVEHAASRQVADQATPSRRGIAVVVGKLIPFVELNALSHEVMLARLTQALSRVWHEAEGRRLTCLD